MPQPQVPLPLSSTYLSVEPDIFIQAMLPPLISLLAAAQAHSNRVKAGG